MIIEDGCIREHGSREALQQEPTSRFYSLLHTSHEEALLI
jgi:ABC-type multidrug transport system fused ATPase/permease subunit